MPFEQIPLFEEAPGAGKSVIVETRQEKVKREAAEAKAAFAHMREVVKNTPSWIELRKTGKVENTDNGRSRHARKLRKKPEADTKSGGWLKEHEDRQDNRVVQHNTTTEHNKDRGTELDNLAAK